jgi:hypothetical protein
MAGENDTPTGGLDDEDAALKAELVALLDGATQLDGAEDTSKDGLLAPIEDKSALSTMITVDEGLDKIESVRTGKTPAPDPDAPVTDIDAQIAAKPAEETPAQPAAPAPISAAADFTALLDGIPEDRRPAITERLTAGHDVLQHFVGRDAELQMHGATSPGQAVARLLHLNEFAQAKPDEYLAWVAQQMNAEAPQDVLTAAAKHLGYKLVPDVEEDDDEFVDEEKKALKAQLRQLQGGKAPIGPDAPQNIAALTITRNVNTFRNALGADGKPLHPLHANFSSEISAKVRAYREANPDKIPTAADLSRFYFEVVPPLAPAPGATAQPAPAAPAAPTQTFAAQPVAVVPEQTQTAAATDRSEAASKMLDGSGPGSDRRPAHTGLTGDALLRAQLEESMAAAKSK